MVDISLLGAGEVEVGVLAVQNKTVVDLSSEDGSSLVSHPWADREHEAELQDDDDIEDGISESLSWLEDVLEEVSDEQLFDGEENACTLEEARSYRMLLRSLGPERFFRDTIENGKITPKRLLTAFGIRPPLFLEEDSTDDEPYYGLLRLAFQRELSKRMKLPQYNSIDDAVRLLKSSRNIIVLTGAGISTSLGIPDFRSKDVGLYAKLEHLGLADPQDVFDINLFREDPSIFYSIARDILPSSDRFSPTHAFIRLLQDQSKLLTNYTQNIDNIEAKAGILPEKLIQCHGSFVTASCIKCGFKVPGEAIFPELKAGSIPQCKRCIETLKLEQGSTGMKRKRSKNGLEKRRQRRFGGSSGSSSDEDDDIPEPGIMKPDITFFGEALPDTFSDRLTNRDKDLVDLVIVIGTSLKVAPVSEVVPYLPAHIPQVYISRTPISHVEFDVEMLGDCDVVVAELCRRAGWDLQHEMIPQDQKVDVETHEALLSRHIFKEHKEESKTE